MAVKLSSRRRWLNVRDYIEKEVNLKVNFSGHHVNYFSAFKYTIIEDRDYVLSPNHADLTNALKTQQASKQSKKRRRKTDNKSSKRTRTSRLSVYEVSQIAVKKRIKSR